MHVLVTGAAGFIGFHLSKRLLARGDRVTGIDNLNDYYDPTLKEARLALLEREAGRLVMAPEDMIDYVIMHELVHLRIPNHSWEFWRQIGLILPEYQEKRLWLNKHAAVLTLD